MLNVKDACHANPDAEGSLQDQVHVFQGIFSNILKVLKYTVNNNVSLST